MEIIDFQNKRWLVKYKVIDNGFSPEKLDWYKWYKRADQVLRRDGKLFFVEEIPDIKFEEIK